MNEPLTVDRLDYPWHVAAVDRAVGLLGRMGLSYVQLDREGILANARRNTGLSDFGNERFIEPMDIMLDNIANLGLTHLAKVAIRASFVKALCSRLRMVDLLKRRPEIKDTPIKRPIFIVGFPRSGTTLLQNLMAQEPNRRGLRFWELMSPVPVTDDPEADRFRRLRAARWTLSASYWLAPEMGAVHEVREHTFEECWYLFIPSFAVLNWDLQTGLDDYNQWLLNTDMTGPYEEYRRWLQLLLQNEGAEHLLLKCPEHLWFLDALLEVFPDACVVWTHRDPVVSIASYCSLISLPRRMLYGRFDPARVGHDVLDRFHTGATRAMEVRKRLGDERFYDVDFLDLVRDPKKVVHDISAHFGLEESPDSDARMDAWLNSGRKDERGAHVYSAERYGIDPTDVHTRFAEYIERFDIPIKREQAG